MMRYCNAHVWVLVCGVALDAFPASMSSGGTASGTREQCLAGCHVLLCCSQSANMTCSVAVLPDVQAWWLATA